MKQVMRSVCILHAGELADRMLKAGVKGRTLTLKVKRRKIGAPEPIKFLVGGIFSHDPVLKLRGTLKHLDF